MGSTRQILKKWFRTTWHAELSFTSAMETIGTKVEMKDFLAKELKGMEPSVGYKCLAKLITENYFQIIFTTNFDRMIEDALIEKGLVEREDFSVNIVGVTEVAAIRENLDSHSPRIKILKLHGDIGYASTMKCTSKETEELPEEIENIFDGLLKKKGFIFVGYGGLDEGILGILEKQTKDSRSILRRKRAPAERSVWWVSPQGLSTEHIYVDVIKSFLRSRGSQDNVIQNAKKNSHLIPLGAFDTFFVILSEKLLGGFIQPIKLSSDEILTEISKAIKTKNCSYLYRYIEFLESEEGNELFLDEEEFTHRVFEIFRVLIAEIGEFDFETLFNVLSLLQNRWIYFQKYLNELPPDSAADKTNKMLVAATHVLKRIASTGDKEKFETILIVVSDLLRFYDNKASIDRGVWVNVGMSLEYFDWILKEVLRPFKDKIINSERCIYIEDYENSEFRLILELFQYVLLMSIIPQLVFYYDNKEQALAGTVGFFLDLREVLSSVREQYNTDNSFSEGKRIAQDVTSLVDALQRRITTIHRLISYKWG